VGSTPTIPILPILGKYYIIDRKEGIIMIDVYFELKETKMESVGGLALLERDPTGINVWRVYKIYPVTETSVLFQRNKNEFVVTNGIYEHEMGTIKIRYINGYININVKEKK